MGRYYRLILGLVTLALVAVSAAYWGERQRAGRLERLSRQDARIVYDQQREIAELAAYLNQESAAREDARKRLHEWEGAHPATGERFRQRAIDAGLIVARGK